MDTTEKKSHQGRNLSVSFSVHPDVLELIDARAEAEGRSRSNLADRIFRAALDPGNHSVRVGDLAGPAKPAPK